MTSPLPPPACAAQADALIAAVARQPALNRTFADMLLASADEMRPPPSLQDRLRCARVALREALVQDDISEARGWIETALRQIGE